MNKTYFQSPYTPSWCAALGTGAIKTRARACVCVCIYIYIYTHTHTHTHTHIEDIKFVSSVRHISCHHASSISSPSTKLRVISRFRRHVFENCALLGYYAEQSGNSLPTFRDNLPVPSSRVKNSKYFKNHWPLKMWLKGCSETSARSCHSRLRNIAEEHSSQTYAFPRCPVKMVAEERLYLI